MEERFGVRGTVLDGPLRLPPNTRLKLAAPSSKGICLFVSDHTLRRSLGAIR